MVQKCYKLEIVIASHNDINSLEVFSHLPRMTELYLRRNKIEDLDEIRHLKNLRNLAVLWLCENPVAMTNPEFYRKWTIALLPRLIKLDNEEVTQEEREIAEAEMLPRIKSLYSGDVPVLPFTRRDAPSRGGRPPVRVCLVVCIVSECSPSKRNPTPACSLAANRRPCGG